MAFRSIRCGRPQKPVWQGEGVPVSGLYGRVPPPTVPRSYRQLRAACRGWRPCCSLAGLIDSGLDAGQGFSLFGG